MTPDVLAPTSSGAVEWPLVGPPEPSLSQEAARRFQLWDAHGLLWLAAFMLAFNQLAVHHMRTPGVGGAHGIRVVSIAVCVVAGGAGLLVLAWERPRVSELPKLLTQVWRDPPAGWVVFTLGAILAIPVLGLYLPILLLDSDSARIVASTSYVQDGHLGYFADTQEVLLPHLVLGPALAVGGLPAAKLVTLVSVQALAGVVAFVTYRITGTMWAASAAVAALFCVSPLLDQAVRLPMYPTMLALGYLGAWAGYRAMIDEQGRWRHAIAAGLLLALSPEAHAVGQLFLAVPLLLAVLAPTLRTAVLATARICVVMLVALLPRVAINLADGGLDYFITPRSDYWVTEGYLVLIQNDFWHYIGVSEGFGEFVRLLPERFVATLGAQGWLVLVAAGVAWALCCRGRARWFVLNASAFFVLAVVVKRIPPFARYFSPIWPGLAILAGVLVAALWRRRTSEAGTVLLRAAGLACSIGLVGAAALTYRDVVPTIEQARVEMEALPIRALVSAIDDDSGVIGARPHQVLLSVTEDIQTWGDQFLSEEDYVTYLTWPSDAEVVDMLERHDIGWVYIDARRVLETPYNDTWLLPSLGLRSRHVEAVAESPDFCRVVEVQNFILYKLGPCPDNASA